MTHTVYVFGRIFVKMRSVVFYVKLLTERQTDRQTNAGHYITSLADVMTGLPGKNSNMGDLMQTVYTIMQQLYCKLRN